jgi:tRNA dimethylallyltransferase
MENSSDFKKNAPIVPIVVIVGPTSIGKSKVAMNTAQSFNGAIVNADSRQVYRYMDIGTAKPSKTDMDIVDHYLFDVVDPNEEYNVARFLADARQSIITIHESGKLPLITGGTGQYLFGLVDGYHAPAVPPNPSFRADMIRKAEEEGSMELWKDLNVRDPVSASKIDYRNIRRVVRALEVCHEMGKPFSEARQRASTSYYEIIIGLYMDRDDLYSRIDARIDAMIVQGWTEEVRKLLDMGFTEDLSSMSSLGYREIASYIKGEDSLENVVSKIKSLTHRFARQQYTWLRPKSRNINWVDVNDVHFMSDISFKIEQHLSKFDLTV